MTNATFVSKDTRIELTQIAIILIVQSVFLDFLMSTKEETKSNALTVGEISIRFSLERDLTFKTETSFIE